MRKAGRAMSVSFRVFIEDDPIDALMVAKRRSIPVILLLTNYNGLGSRLVSLINKNIHLEESRTSRTQTFAIEHQALDAHLGALRRGNRNAAAHLVRAWDGTSEVNPHDPIVIANDAARGQAATGMFQNVRLG